MKTIDADKVSGLEVERAIRDALHDGETLTIMRGGKVVSQVVTSKGPPPCTCTERIVGAICLDCDGSVDHLLTAPTGGETNG